jgi:hypothetical protein
MPDEDIPAADHGPHGFDFQVAGRVHTAAWTVTVG